MTTLVHALSHAFQTNAEIDSLKIVAILGGLGLLVFLLWMLSFLTYGVDLSPGFFCSTQKSAGPEAQSFDGAMGGTESTLGVATANKKWPQHLGETHTPVRLFWISHFKIEVASVEGVTERRRRLAANNGDRGFARRFSFTRGRRGSILSARRGPSEVRIRRGAHPP